MNKQSFSRRDFLKLTLDSLLALGGLIGLGGLIRFLSYKTEPPKPTEFDLGLAKDYQPHSRTVFAQIPALLIRGESGFTALSLVCTHLGCTVEAQPEGFACPCHGSQFDSDGHPTKGPATTSLKVFKVEQTDDRRLILHTT